MKSHPTPFGSTVVPSADYPTFPGVGSRGTRGTPGGTPNAAFGSIGIAGPKVTLPNGNVIKGATLPSVNAPSAVATAVDSLIDAIADRIADKVLAKLDARGQVTAAAAPDVEQLNDETATPTHLAGSVTTSDGECKEQALYPSIVRDVPDEERVATYSQMHTDLEQALRERDGVKVMRFAPSPIGFRVTRMTGPIAVFECAAYAGCFGQGYTDGAAPDEYALVVDGRRLRRVDWEPANVGPGRSESFTFVQALAVIDALINSIDNPIDEYGNVDFEHDTVAYHSA